MIRHALALTLLSFAVVSGCGTESLKLQPREIKEGPWQGTAALINYDLATSDADVLKNGCTMVLGERTSHQEYSVVLAGDQHFALFDIPAGHYEGKTLICPSRTQWELKSFLKGEVPISEGKINYLGKVTFRFSSNAQGMVFSQGDQKAVTEALVSVIKIMPATWRTSIMNPFTRKPIGEAVIAAIEKQTYSGATYRMDIHTKRFVKKGETPPSTDSLAQILKQCDQSEQQRFPYRLGTFKWTATFDGGILQSLDEDSHASSSDEFTSCMEHGIRGFRPSGSGKLVIIVSL